MDPARLLTTLSMVLALAGIGGALRACGSFARTSSRAGTRAVTTIPARVPRVTVYPRLTTSAGRSAGRSTAAGALGVGEDAPRAASRARLGSAARHVGSNADSLLDVADDIDDEDERPSRGQR